MLLSQRQPIWIEGVLVNFRFVGALLYQSLHYIKVTFLGGVVEHCAAFRVLKGEPVFSERLDALLEAGEILGKGNEVKTFANVVQLLLRVVLFIHWNLAALFFY